MPNIESNLTQSTEAGGLPAAKLVPVVIAVNMDGTPISGGGGSGPTTPVKAPALTGGTERSGTSTGAAQQLAAANANRRSLLVQNTSDTDMRVSLNGAASATKGYLLKPEGSFNVPTSGAVSLFCTETGKTFEATETSV